MDAINSFLSIPVVQFIGGALVSATLYWLVRRDLRHEARELQRLSIMMINAMEAAGDVKWAREENGDPTGRLFLGLLVSFWLGVDARVACLSLLDL